MFASYSMRSMHINQNILHRNGRILKILIYIKLIGILCTDNSCVKKKKIEDVISRKLKSHYSLQLL